MMDEEIRQALSEVQEMKKMCGNINMKLTNIVTQRGQDWKKKLEAEYQRGFDDGKAQREHDDKIEVGDEVRDDDGETYVITCINDDGTFDALYPDGTAFSRADFSIIYELTGRHFDIQSILEAMKA